MRQVGRPPRQSQLIDKEAIAGGRGGWDSRELEKMDSAFAEAMCEAIEAGGEKPEATRVSTTAGTKRPLINYQRE